MTTQTSGAGVRWAEVMSRGRLAFLLCVLLAAAAPAVGQLAPLDEPAEQAVEPSLSIDAEALLTHEQVLPDRLDTATWVVEPNMGRRLVALPLLIEPAEAEAELGTSPSLSMRGGRFLMWLVETEDDTGQMNRRGRGMGRGMTGPRDRDMGPGMGGPRERGMDRGMTDPRRPAMDRRTRPEPAATDDASQLPENAPRFARRITVHPDGRLEWRLERALPNAELHESDEPYVLRIRPDRLRDLQPDRPGRAQRGANQDRAAMARQRREADQTFREDQRAFTELRNAVMALPDTFEVDGAVRVWAIFELADSVRELTLAGEGPGLPWSISMNDLETLRGVAGGGGRRGGFEDAALASVRRIVAADNELGHRLAAYALVEADVIRDLEPHGALHTLLQSLLQSSDAEARRTVLAELTEATPQTSATLSLLRYAAAQEDPEMKLLSLRGMLQADPRDPNRLTQMVNTTNEVLADPDGPEPGLVLAELVEAVSDQGEEVVVYLAANLSFDRLSSDRLASAVRYVVSAAGEQPVAAGWLDRQLLGNANPNVVEQTLEVIAAADAGSPWVRRAAQRGLAAVFGRPTVDEETAEADAPLEPLTLTEPIPIHGPTHALFRSLNSGHERVRELAWQSLVKFQFVDASARYRQGRDRGRGRPITGTADDDQMTGYDALVDAALGRAETPPQAVTFLSRQPDGLRAAGAMLQLLLEGDGTATSQAAHALVGSGWPLDEALADLSGRDRVEVGERLYLAITGTSPRVTGLLGLPPDRRGAGNVPAWFGERVAEGPLPDPGAWTEAFRNEDDLLDLASSSDSTVAEGAVAALVYGAGGDETAVQEQIERFAELGGTDRMELQSAWSSARQTIYARRLAEAEGSYRFVALVHAREDYRGQARRAGRGDQASAEPPVRITLGVVDLVADGRSISLSNDIVPLSLADTELAIRIERVHALQGFRDESLAELSLDSVREPLDLRPQTDGSWAGSVRLPDGRQLEVRMEPVG